MVSIKVLSHLGHVALQRLGEERTEGGKPTAPVHAAIVEMDVHSIGRVGL
jgi:hypothetical protein